jgi:hypothetical protein
MDGGRGVGGDEGSAAGFICAAGLAGAVSTGFAAGFSALAGGGVTGFVSTGLTLAAGGFSTADGVGGLGFVVFTAFSPEGGVSPELPACTAAGFGAGVLPGSDFCALSVFLSSA